MGEEDNELDGGVWTGRSFPPRPTQVVFHEAIKGTPGRRDPGASHPPLSPLRPRLAFLGLPSPAQGSASAGRSPAMPVLPPSPPSRLWILVGPR